MDKFILDRKNRTVIIFDKPISEKFKIFSLYQDWEYGCLPSVMFGHEI